MILIRRNDIKTWNTVEMWERSSRECENDNLTNLHTTNREQGKWKIYVMNLYNQRHLYGSIEIEIATIFIFLSFCSLLTGEKLIFFSVTYKNQKICAKNHFVFDYLIFMVPVSCSWLEIY